MREKPPPVDDLSHSLEGGHEEGRWRSESGPGSRRSQPQTEPLPEASLDAVLDVHAYTRHRGCKSVLVDSSNFRDL
jgi:hypothetical protein